MSLLSAMAFRTGLNGIDAALHMLFVNEELKDPISFPIEEKADPI